MARIRTIKPELFSSETLAGVTVFAERTFVGLLTQSDDRGCHRDHAAIIAGVLWPLRPEHTPVHVEEDLQQLANAGLICRYTGCDGRPFLHIVTWARHQKIDRPSKPRSPLCREHQEHLVCGVCGSRGCKPVAQAPAATVGRGLGEGSVSPRAEIAEGARNGDGVLAGFGESAGEGRISDRSSSPRRQVVEGSGTGSRTLDLGPRIMDRGSTSDAESRARGGVPELLAAFVAGCTHRPPQKVVDRLEREIRALLDEGVDPVHIRAGLERFGARPMHPAVLPSLVNQVMNTPPGDGLVRPGSPVNVPPHRGWSNPADPAAYAEEL
ncbi:hypothetical protein [Streptomyces carpaticus]|uniref:hypothetical protein n=1 Tax=Streptomyces carpaticus TaxID=285558 RepID=UPI0031F8C2F8